MSKLEAGLHTGFCCVFGGVGEGKSKFGRLSDGVGKAKFGRTLDGVWKAKFGRSSAGVGMVPFCKCNSSMSLSALRSLSRCNSLSTTSPNACKIFV